jgi:hypothetical protein
MEYRIFVEVATEPSGIAVPINRGGRFPSESVAAFPRNPHWTPDSRYVMFVNDENGDENQHLASGYFRIGMLPRNPSCAPIRTAKRGRIMRQREQVRNATEASR